MIGTHILRPSQVPDGPFNRFCRFRIVSVGNAGTCNFDILNDSVPEIISWLLLASSIERNPDEIPDVYEGEERKFLRF